MIYLDSAATTYPAQEVIDNYVDALRKFPYNPSSPYEGGLEARKLLEKSRKTVADCLGCKSEEVIFTSGGTEGNNLVIRGFFEDKDSGVLITTQIEHPSVLRVAEYLEKEACGFIKVYYLPVDYVGRINLNDLINTLKYEVGRGVNPETILVSIQCANNEIGTIQHIKMIHHFTQKYGVFLHSDQVQFFPHFGADMNCDALTVSGHKFGALRGTGFVYINEKLQKHLSPLLLGGGQEFGIRPGTENVAGMYAMSCHINWLYKYIKNSTLEKRIDFINRISDGIIDLDFQFNGYADVPIWSLTFPDVEASSLVSLLSEKGIYVASGSACSSYEAKPSHVLTAIGLSDDDAKSTIRICWNDELADEDIDEFVKWLVFYVKLLRGE